MRSGIDPGKIAGGRLRDKPQKLAVYFRPLGTYWQLSDPERPRAVASGLGHYPVDMLPRLDSGLFGPFDAEGLPLRRSAIMSGG